MKLITLLLVVLRLGMHGPLPSLSLYAFMVWCFDGKTVLILCYYTVLGMPAVLPQNYTRMISCSGPLSSVGDVYNKPGDAVTLLVSFICQKT
jgi:hypothetical protein